MQYNSNLTFLLGLAVSCAVLGRAAAAKRNRHVALWGVVCFCFPITLLVIWSLSSLPPRQELPLTHESAAR
jgi:hypothetical protein